MGLSLAARITGETKGLKDAEEFARSVLSMPVSIAYYRAMARIALGLTALQRGDMTEAAEQYEGLSFAGGLMHSYVSVDRIRGLLARMLGENTQAIDHFQASLDLCRKGRYLQELAWTCFDYAETLLVDGDNKLSGSPESAEKAGLLLDESLALTIEVGMRPLNERVTALQELAGSRSLGGDSMPDGLSQREVEVLRLISGGKTDREIADELFISFRTVGNHVRSILNKTGAANRTEAAVYANQHGLAPPAP